MEYIAIFKGNVTAGGTDGTEVSSGGLMTAPVEAILNTGADATQTLAVRCAQGLSAASVDITSTAAWLTVSLDGNTFSNSVTITNVGDTNKLFYAKMTAGSTVGVETGFFELEATVMENV